MQNQIQILIPEATADELTQRVLTNSHVTMQTLFSISGFSVGCEIKANCGSTNVVFLDPPAPKQVELRDLAVSGSVSVTQISFNLSDFLTGIDPALAAAIRAAHLPNVSLVATQLATLPYGFKATIDCQPRVVVSSGNVSIVVDVAAPPTHVDVSPMGPIIAMNLANAARTGLQQVTWTIPPNGPQHIPAQVIDSIVRTIGATWIALWPSLASTLNHAADGVLGRLQIFQQTLALALFTTPAHIASGAQLLNIPPWSAQPGDVKLIFTGTGGIPGVSVDIKDVKIDIARHLMTATLLLA
jgi:hypothetical protein